MEKIKEEMFETVTLSKETVRDQVGCTLMMLIYDDDRHSDVGTANGYTLSLNVKDRFWESEIVLKKRERMTVYFRLKDYQKEWQDIISGEWVKGLVDDITTIIMNVL